MRMTRKTVIARDNVDDASPSLPTDDTRSAEQAALPAIGIGVIGRNEGQRLIDCLNALGSHKERTVYVDSGSTDGSAQAAAQMVAGVVQLDMSIPFTAARARNAGFDRLMQSAPDTGFVQFIDGDCQLNPQWLEESAAFLTEHDRVAIVFGRRREQHPERTIFNALCDREWDGQPGQVTECGGDILARAAALRDVGLYNERLIAGEEPDLCVRLRDKGWLVWRLPLEMTLHDANITRFGQWWRRSVRAGHAFAEVSRLHKGSPSRIWQRNVGRAIVWGCVLPIVAIAGTVISPLSLGLLLLYPLQIARLSRRQDGNGVGRWEGAFFDVLGKFAEFQGVLQFWVNRLMKRRQRIIEYK
jgi:GT2 family glycosyltransferase